MGELLARLRAVVGPKLPIVASLDLHANVTHRMLREADALVSYRTYPHVDMADTGARVAHLLVQRADGLYRQLYEAQVEGMVPMSGATRHQRGPA